MTDVDRLREIAESARSGAVLISVRVDTFDGPMPGSVTEACAAGCGHDVWVSKASGEALPPDVRAVCMECALEALKAAGGGR